jgi:hypothetical protein
MKDKADISTVLVTLVNRLQEGESIEDILKHIRPDDPAIMLPGWNDDEVKGIPMDKASAKSNLSRLEQLDLKGIGPDMLAAISNRDVQTVMQQPIIMQRTGERLERIRRLKDELKAPGSHLQPAKSTNPAQSAADEMPNHSSIPAAPGSPMPPSNMLGGFSPEQMGELPKMSSVKVDSSKYRKQAYKYGFFLKVAEMGLRPAELEKRALLGPLLAWLGVSAAKKGKDEAVGAAGVLKNLVSSGLLLPMLAAPVIGAGLGGAYRYTTAPGYSSPEEFQHVERLAELKKHTRAARRRARRQKG